MWLADAAAALAVATEQLYQATARNWWRHHPHRAAVTGRVAEVDRAVIPAEQATPT
jgi:hypothetical protein